jgi:signal transduction histidine kinase
MNAQQTVLLVSEDGHLCAATRRDLEIRLPAIRVSAVSSVDAALQIIAEAAPSVILLVEDAAGGNGDEGTSHLEVALKLLCAFAPVVVLGRSASGPPASATIAAGLAEYVPRTEGSMKEALGMLERRLEGAPGGPTGATDWSRDFAEILRHELNNPLTGILGNAELLLAEITRVNDGRLPHGGLERVETIAALAMRMRETVRQLSQEWEVRREPARSV